MPRTLITQKEKGEKSKRKMNQLFSEKDKKVNKGQMYSFSLVTK